MDPGEEPGGPPPHIFRPEWGPKGRKKFFWGQATPLSHGMDDRFPSPPPLIWRSGFASVFCLCFKHINICVLVWVGTWRPTVVFLARLLLASSRNHGEDYGNEKITKCNRLNKQNKNSKLAAGLFDRFLYRHHTTNVVKRHRSGNSAILAFISKIVVWLNDRRDFNFVGNTHIKCHTYCHTATELKFERRKHFNRQFKKPVLARVILETSFHMMWVIFLDVTIAF